MALRGNAVHFLASALLLCVVDAAVVKSGTPIDRVISLLGKLEAQIETEGKKEAAEYDKFACFCKDEADDIQYAIEKSEKIIKALKAKIEKLDSEIKVLITDISDLEDTIKDRETKIQTAVDDRKTENDEYVKAAEEVADAITAIEGAIEALKDKKKDMKKAKLNLLQDKLLEVLSLSSSSPSESRLSAIQALTQAPDSPAKAHAYTYQSGDIIATLEKLKEEFKADKKKLNVEEKEKLFAFEEKKQSLENEKAFAEKDKIEKETLKQDKETEKGELETEETKETKAKEDDEGFRTDLEADCSEKAVQWDQRSKSRADELTAIGKAMEKLKGGVKENYGSNSLAAGASFLQLRGKGSLAAVVGRVTSLVSGEAKRLHSTSLTGLALKLSTGGHFASVVTLIKDLITKLEDEAKAASTSKSECDTNMKKAVALRDNNKLAMEEAEATIAMKGAAKKKLADEVNKLNKEMAGLRKAKLEATELRAEEKANNAVTLEESKSGKTAVDDAITVLQDFYGSFLQKGPNRDGKTIGDAPKLSYEGDYSGKKEASSGIIGILQVIADDFQKTIDDTETGESDAETAFTAFETENDQVTEDKETLRDTKLDDIKTATTDITDAKDTLKDADDMMNNAMEELEKVAAMCMTGEGTFEERKKQREEEIKALKGAMKILEDWKDL